MPSCCSGPATSDSARPKVSKSCLEQPRASPGFYSQGPEHVAFGSRVSGYPGLVAGYLDGRELLSW